MSIFINMSDLLSHLRERFFWAEKASNVLTKMVGKVCDFVDEVIIYYDKNNDLRILVYVNRPVLGPEIDIIKDEVKKMRGLLAGVSPIFDNQRYIPVSIKLRESKLQEQVINYLKKLQ